jgi:hypothetical protein
VSGSNSLKCFDPAKGFAVQEEIFFRRANDEDKAFALVRIDSSYLIAESKGIARNKLIRFLSSYSLTTRICPTFKELGSSTIEKDWPLGNERDRKGRQRRYATLEMNPVT